jgi:predicted neutral ceramidase superfamily lipid hydrolase
MRLAAPEVGERPLALKMAGALWLTAALSTALAQAIPGAVTRHWQLELGISAAVVVWGVACLRISPRRAGALVFHAPAVLALPTLAVNIAATGGVHSYCTYDFFFLVSFCAYFFSFRQAIVYSVLCGVVQAAPLLYDQHAVRDGLLVELFTAVPAYVVLADGSSSQPPRRAARRRA